MVCDDDNANKEGMEKWAKQCYVRPSLTHSLSNPGDDFMVWSYSYNIVLYVF